MWLRFNIRILKAKDYICEIFITKTGIRPLCYCAFNIINNSKI